jgi:GNAT superfamily N-acetyltransferase
MLKNDLTPLTLDLVEPASLACARAFAGDPSTHYLIPDPSKRPNLRYSFEYFLKLAVLSTGYEVYATSPGCEGIAVWVQPDATESVLDHFRAGWPFLPLRCGWQHLFREAAVDAHFGKLRKELAPRRHLYLALLAVDPAHQGHWFASKLIHPVLERLNEEGMPAYLETQNLKNVAMYGRWGFRLLREEIMPGSDFKMYLMLRDPAKSGE